MEPVTPKIDIGTKVRTFALTLALVNQLLVVLGFSPIPFDEEQTTLVLTTIFTGVVAVWTWWKNNDITKKARNKK